MENQVATLIVSGQLENRKQLLRILDGLSANVFVVGTLAQAREVLAKLPVAVIFCEERVSDGPYRDLLAFIRDQHKTIEFIVMLNTGGWSEYLDALRLGIQAMRCLLQPTDLELALIHAVRRGPRPRLARAVRTSAA